MRLADMTWQEVREHLTGRDALLVPVGTCEQHGPHLPLGCDTLIAEAFADRISDATGVPVAPTLAYGVNLPCDLFTSGTAGLSFDTLRDCVRDLLADWKRQGFRRFFIVTAHACASGGFGFAHHEALKQGSFPTMQDPGCDVSILFPYWTDASDLLSRQKGASHACEVETALALHLFPDRVRGDRVRDPVGGLSVDRYRAFPEGVAQGPPAADWHGGAGFPSAATADQGARIFARLLEPLVAYVRARTA
jgi:creatinine amidohydrolase